MNELQLYTAKQLSEELPMVEQHLAELEKMLRDDLLLAETREMIFQRLECARNHLGAARAYAKELLGVSSGPNL